MDRQVKGAKDIGRERKERIFKFLHNPSSKWSHVYHSMVSALICTYATMQNYYLNFDEFKESHEGAKNNQTTPSITQLLASPESASVQPPIDYLVIIVDSTLAGFFMLELALRIWSSTYIGAFSKGIRGCWLYFKAYRFRRVIDLLGLFFCILSIVIQVGHIGSNWQSIVRIGQVLQLYQANRVLSPYMKVILRTIFGYQAHYLLFCLFLIFMMITLSSAAVYLSEYDVDNPQIFSIFESFWFMFETFTTIGYGDVVPKSWIGKFVVCILSVLGIFVFSLPSNIIGTSLSIKMRQDPRKSLKYRKAVRLIQSIWRCRISNFQATEVKHNSAMLWRAFGLSSKVSHLKINLNYEALATPKWKEQDLLAIWFIMKTKYFMARYRFKRQNLNMSSYSDVSQQNDELWQRIDYIENDLSALSSAIYECLHNRLAALRAATMTLERKIYLRYGEHFQRKH